MPSQNLSYRLSLLVAAIAAGVIAAMIVEIALAHRGMELTSALQGLERRSGRQMNAALTWWAITGIAFMASFAVGFVMSRFTWLYLRSLRWVAAAALVLVLAVIADEVPLAAPEAAGPHALATLAALVVAMMMSAFGGFFAIRR